MKDVLTPVASKVTHKSAPQQYQQQEQPPQRRPQQQASHSFNVAIDRTHHKPTTAAPTKPLPSATSMREEKMREVSKRKDNETNSISTNMTITRKQNTSANTSTNANANNKRHIPNSKPPPVPNRQLSRELPASIANKPLPQLMDKIAASDDEAASHNTSHSRKSKRPAYPPPTPPNPEHRNPNASNFDYNNNNNSSNNEIMPPMKSIGRVQSQPSSSPAKDDFLKNKSMTDYDRDDRIANIPAKPLHYKHKRNPSTNSSISSDDHSLFSTNLVNDNYFGTSSKINDNDNNINNSASAYSLQNGRTQKTKSSGRGSQRVSLKKKTMEARAQVVITRTGNDRGNNYTNSKQNGIEMERPSVARIRSRSLTSLTKAQHESLIQEASQVL